MKLRTILTEGLGIMGWGMFLSLFFFAYPDGYVSINMNNWGEYWIELILFSAVFIFMIITIIKDWRD